MTEEQLPFDNHEDFLKSTEIAGHELTDVCKDIQSIYQADNRPWIIGFSGGKDSTAVLSLIYASLLKLPNKARHKHIYVVSSNTLVETPVVVDMISGVLKDINKQAKKDRIPMSAHPVYPKMDQTFWVNLLGRGYPAPQQQFRWCTERMKIDPVSEFITETVAKHGEVVVVLGSRSQESASRAQVVARHKIDGSALSRHSSLPNAYTFMPIVDWSADDVWEYLMSAPRSWGGTNRELFELYKGSNQGECPVVIDKSTPSCGNSRFGCWTCTVVTKDKAIHGLIESGEKWMQPLLDFRNKLHDSTDPANKNKYRNFKRRTGKVTYARGDITDDTNQERKHIPGPYWMNQRQEWLKDLLDIEKGLRDNGHDMELIKRDELQAIRQEWMRDPNEPDWADSLPRIFAEVYPGEDIEWIENDAGAFTEPDANLLGELGERFEVAPELIMKLIEVEISMTGLSRRTGILTKLESVLNRDWESLESINARNAALDNSTLWAEKLQDLRSEYESMAQ